MESMIRNTRKTKNIVKRELKTSDGVIFYSFMSKETGPVVELEEHINGMIMNSHPYNTVSAKASDLAKFYDYYIEASRVIHSSEYLSELQDNYAYSASHELRTSLTLIFHSYPAFLLDGKLSKNPLARICAQNLDSAPYARKSVTRYISTLCDFVSASNALENSLKQQRKIDRLVNVDQPLTAVGQELGLLRKLSVKERNVLIERSYLASCISGGAKVSKVKNFFRLPKESKRSQDLHFPMEYVGQFLLNTKSHRDRAMYALCFGGGLRFSDALSIRIQDIDIVKEEVRLHDKKTISYLDAMNYKCMRGKPISHFSVKLIEPFNSFFFNELMMYIDKERANSNSEYLFLQLRGTKNKLTGEMVYHPYYKTKISSINDMWKANLKRAGLTGKEFEDKKTHSMRHYYGMYMLNFAPNDVGGIGYSLEEVRFFMRHESIKSTEIYARHDISKMIEKVDATNRLLQTKELSFYEQRRKNKLTVITDKSK